MKQLDDLVYEENETTVKFRINEWAEEVCAQMEDLVRRVQALEEKLAEKGAQCDD